MNDASPGPDDPARLFEALRQRLLRTILATMSISAGLIVGLYVVHVSRVGLFPARLGLFFALLTSMPVLWYSQRWLRTRTVALIFIAYLYGIGVYMLGLAGLTAGGALLTVFTILLSALFFGQRGVVISLALSLASLAVIGPLWTLGMMPEPLTPFFNARDPLVWWRYGLVLATLCAILGFTFNSLISKLEKTTKELSATLRREREERDAQLRLRAALEHSQRLTALGQLAAGLAHDLGNSLMVLSSGTELIQRDPGASERVKALAGQVLESLATTSDTLEQMRYLGRATQQPMRVSAGEPLGWLERSLGSLLPSSVRLSVEANSEHDLHVDPARLQQALLNLGLNARDAMPHGGALTITACDREVRELPPGWQADPGRFVMLSVRDTGTGMDAVTLERIFEPLFTTKGERGTGLGLAMVRTFVHEAGGFIVVESSPARGTSMHLYLPAMPPVADAPALARSAVATT
jgi:signal transduction histidine kinase